MLRFSFQGANTNDAGFESNETDSSNYWMLPPPKLWTVEAFPCETVYTAAIPVRSHASINGSYYCPIEIHTNRNKAVLFFYSNSRRIFISDQPYVQKIKE